MSTETKTTSMDPQELANSAAVLRQLLDGIPVDPDVARRIDERAARIIEEIRRIHGLIDDATFQQLLSDDDEG